MATTLTTVNRSLGALIGVHAGDSLGATVEFASWATIRARYPGGRGLGAITGGGPFSWPPGHATDDTDLTRAVLLAYRDRARASSGSSGSFDVSRAAGRYMLDWLDGRWPDRSEGTTPRDIGHATAVGLERFRTSGDPARAGAGPGQAGNGSLMRCVPTGLFVRDPEALVAESVSISRITHDDPRCTGACAAYNAIIAALVSGRGVDEAIAAGLAVAEELEGDGNGSRPGPRPVYGAIRLGRNIKVRDLAENGPADLPGKGAGYVLESLTIAVSALLDDRPLAEVLIDVVRIGKDTDTNAAVAGGLLGARDGAEAIPKEWVEKLQFAQEFTDIVTELAVGG